MKRIITFSQFHGKYIKINSRLFQNREPVALDYVVPDPFKMIWSDCLDHLEISLSYPPSRADS